MTTDPPGVVRHVRYDGMRKPPLRGGTLKKLLPKIYGEWHPGRIGQIGVIPKEFVDVRLSYPGTPVKCEMP